MTAWREGPAGVDPLRARLMVIAAGALALRLSFVLWYPQLPVRDDAASYDQAARALAAGAGDPPTVLARGPVYPALIAATYRLSGTTDPLVVRVLQAFLGTAAVALVYATGAVLFGTQAGVWAAALAAAYPPFIAYTGLLLTETLTVVLVLGHTALVLAALRRPGWARWIAAGAVGGVLALHRTDMALPAAASVLAVMPRAGARRAMVWAVAMLVVVVPWVGWNARATGAAVIAREPSPGQVLWISTVDTRGAAEWGTEAEHMRAYDALVAGRSPADADRVLRAEAWRRIAADPAGYAMLCLRRVPAFWLGGHSHAFAGLEESMGSYLRRGAMIRVIVKSVMLAYNFALIVLGAAGFYLAWQLRRAEGAALLAAAAPVAVKALMHTALFAALRYQLPVMGLVMVFAAFALCHARGVVRELAPA